MELYVEHMLNSLTNKDPRVYIQLTYSSMKRMALSLFCLCSYMQAKNIIPQHKPTLKQNNFPKSLLPYATANHVFFLAFANISLLHKTRQMLAYVSSYINRINIAEHIFQPIPCQHCFTLKNNS